MRSCSAVETVAAAAVAAACTKAAGHARWGLGGVESEPGRNLVGACLDCARQGQHASGVAHGRLRAKSSPCNIRSIL
eukprot:347337-Chlamydomonas_euryale.AAC.2